MFVSIVMRGEKVVDNYFDGASSIKAFKELKACYFYLKYGYLSKNCPSISFILCNVYKNWYEVNIIS